MVVNPSYSSCLVLSFQFLTGLLLTVLTDIIHISVYYPLHGYLTGAKRFGVGMAIFSLLLKPGSCYFVYRMYRERGGEYIFNIGRMLPLHQCGPHPLVLGKAAREDFVPFSLSLMQLDSASFQGGGWPLSSSCLLSLLCFCWVLGLKFTFFLSSLADLESSSDSHFAYNGIEATAVTLTQLTQVFPLFHFLYFVHFLGALGCPSHFANLFLLWESKGIVPSTWIMHVRKGWISNFVLHVLAILIVLDCYFLTWEMGLMFILCSFAWRHSLFLLAVVAGNTVAALPERVVRAGYSVSFFSKHSWC